MSAPVTPKSDTTAVPAVRAEAAGAERQIRVALSDANSAALSPGTVLNVEIEREGNRSGIILRGQFIPAKLPANLVDGQRIQVQVQEASDALVLKLVNLAPQNFENYFSNTIKDLITQLLPNLDLKPLRLSASPLPDLLAQNLLGLSSKPQEGENETITVEQRAQNEKVTQILERLFSGRSILNGPQLENSEQLQKFLKNFDTDSLLKGLGDARAALQKLGDPKLQPGQLKFVELLESTLKSLLDSKEPLNFESKANASILGPQLKLYLLASQNALQQQNTTTLNAINAELPALKRLDNPLLSLQKILLHIDFSKDPPTNLTKSATEFIKALSIELHRAFESQVPEKELREVLSKHQLKAKAIIEEFKLPALQAPAIAQASETLQSLEHLARSQEALNQLNPIMNALGEPVLILFPALAGGLLSKWQISVSNPHVDSNAGKRKSSSGKGNFERIDLSLSLPGLGPIEVNFAHRKGEALINFTVTHEESSNFIKEHSDTLSKRFQELGFENTLISSQAGTPKTALPSWFQELSKNTIVA